MIKRQTLNNLFQKDSILVAHKREKNLGELLQRSDPYNIKSDLTDNVQHGYVKCGNCDSCRNLVDETNYTISFATGRKYIIQRDSTCTSKNVVYIA